jgi:hypothetical protein
MAVPILIRDSWRGNRNTDEVIESPPWIVIEAAIRSLNQKERTLVAIHESESKQMVVGGGGGIYVAYVTSGDESFNKLTNPEGREEGVVLVVGGQEGEYPHEECVSLDTVLRAARTFADRGIMDPALRWVAE